LGLYHYNNNVHKIENILIDWNGESNKQLKHKLRQERKDKWMVKLLYMDIFLRQTRPLAANVPNDRSFEE